MSDDDDTSFTGSRLVVLPKDAFDPEREFFDHIDVEVVRNDTPLDVDGWEDPSLFDRLAKSVDDDAVRIDENDEEQNDAEPDLDVDGWEQSLFAKAKKYLNPRNK